MNSIARRVPLFRWLSSVKLGVTLLALILLYASLGSALPQLRGAVELTEMQVFRHFVFTALVALFCLCLIVTTLRRIPFRFVNVGVLTVHTGLLLLAAGSALYFGTKVEGDILLQSPRVQIASVAGGRSRVIAEFLAEKGGRWSSVMPAFGGEVALELVDVESKDGGDIQSAVMNIRTGEARTTTRLTANNEGVLFAGDRLQARLVTFPTQDVFYDDDVPALYLKRESDASQQVVPIAGLPIHRERYLSGSGDLVDTAGRPMPSKRSSPHLALAGLDIPTGWLEPWHLPIDLSMGDGPFDVTITGYVPYVSRFESRLCDGGATLNPGVNLKFDVGGAVRTVSLLAKTPARSLASLGIPVEFVWLEQASHLDEHVRPLLGPHELEIRVRNPPAHQRVSIESGQSIHVEGTTYDIKVTDLRADWPMMTPGYEGASSPMASVDVTCEGRRYNRTVIQRFPELSQDIDEKGVRHREGPYDPNLILRYRTSADGWITFAAGHDRSPTLAVFDPEGHVERHEMAVGLAQDVAIASVNVRVTAEAVFEQSRERIIPILEPLETRRPNLSPRSVSAIRLHFKGRGDRSGWSDDQWCAFSSYPDIDPKTIRVEPIAGEPWEITYSRMRHPLGATIAAGKLAVQQFPGRESVESWKSDFRIAEPGMPPVVASVRTNATAHVGDWTLFQSGASKDNWSYTVIGVGNRRGITAMVLACILITVGCLFAFYVKPVLLKRAAARGRQAGGRSQPTTAAAQSAEESQFAQAASGPVQSHAGKDVGAATQESPEAMTHA